MPLTTFQASVGPKAGNVYVLPQQKQRPSLVGAFTTDQTQPAQTQGMLLGAGVGTAFPGSGQLQTTFSFMLNLLVLAGYAGTFAGMMTAVSAFTRNVTMGGLGILTDSPPSGMQVDGIDVVTRTCTARVIAATFTPQGDTSGELDVTFENPSGGWTCNMADMSNIFVLWPS